MIKNLLVLVMMGLALAHFSPFIVLSQNPQVPTLLAFDDVINIIKNKHVPYQYFDITSSPHQQDQRAKITQIIHKIAPTALKHRSLLNPQEQQNLKQSLVAFNSQNIYTHANFTKNINKTLKLQIDSQQVSSDVLRKADMQSLVILKLNSEGRRLLQEVSQTSLSPMLSVMTPSALSGLFVSGFLLVVLLIGVSCLMDLKTNDRFPRSLLNVGKQS